jgi:hypothetical protein
MVNEERTPPRVYKNSPQIYGESENIGLDAVKKARAYQSIKNYKPHLKHKIRQKSLVRICDRGD